MDLTRETNFGRFFASCLESNCDRGQLCQLDKWQWTGSSTYAMPLLWESSTNLTKKFIMFKTWVLNFWQIWLKLKPSFVNNPTTILLFPFVTVVVTFNVNAYKFFLTLKCRSLTCTIHNKCFELMTLSTKHCLVEPVHGQTLPFMFLESVPLCLVKKRTLSLVFLLEERNDLNDNYPIMAYVH